MPFEGHELLVFEVAPAERAVMVQGDGFPRRVHDKGFQESEEKINAIKSRGQVESIELDAAPGIGLEALDEGLIRRTQERAGANTSQENLPQVPNLREVAQEAPGPLGAGLGG